MKKSLYLKVNAELLEDTIKEMLQGIKLVSLTLGYQEQASFFYHIEFELDSTANEKDLLNQFETSFSGKIIEEVDYYNGFTVLAKQLLADPAQPLQVQVKKTETLPSTPPKIDKQEITSSEKLKIYIEALVDNGDDFETQLADWVINTLKQEYKTSISKISYSYKPLAQFDYYIIDIEQASLKAVSVEEITKQIITSFCKAAKNFGITQSTFKSIPKDEYASKSLAYDLEQGDEIREFDEEFNKVQSNSSLNVQTVLKSNLPDSSSNPYSFYPPQLPETTLFFQLQALKNGELTAEEAEIFLEPIVLDLKNQVLEAKINKGILQLTFYSMVEATVREHLIFNYPTLEEIDSAEKKIHEHPTNKNPEIKKFKLF